MDNLHVEDGEDALVSEHGEKRRINDWRNAQRDRDNGQSGQDDWGPYSESNIRRTSPSVHCNGWVQECGWKQGHVCLQSIARTMSVSLDKTSRFERSHAIDDAPRLARPPARLERRLSPREMPGRLNGLLCLVRLTAWCHARNDLADGARRFTLRWLLRQAAFSPSHST